MVTTATLTIGVSIGAKGQMLNHQFSLVSPKINNSIIKMARINRNGENGSLLFSLFLALASVTNKQMADSPVAITHRLG